MRLVSRRTIARRFAVAAALVTLATTTLVAVAAAPAFAGTDDYPSPWRAPTAQDSVYDSWGELNRECTSFVAWRLHSRNGFEMPFHDMATGWGSDATTRGYTVNMTPAVGAVAWWSFGHVAWVEAVSGSSVTVEEYNYDYHGNYNERTIAASSVSGYIHFKDISAGSQPAYQSFVGDFNGDGQVDLGLRDTQTGMFYLRYGPSFAAQDTFQWDNSTSYQAFAGDFNADGHADVGLRNPASGMFYARFGPDFMSQTAVGWDNSLSTYQSFMGDYNHDGQVDVGLRNPVTGMFYVRYGPSFIGQDTPQWDNSTNYQAFIGDFNSDGHMDIGLRNPATGVFFTRYGPAFTTQTTVGWDNSLSTYQSFMGDYNHDGQVDVGLRNPVTGMFYVRYGPSYTAQTAYQWAAG